jgi:hypothetical protein
MAVSMRNHVLAIVLAVACASGTTPVVAKEKADEQAQAAKPNDGQTAAENGKADKNRKICKVEVATGSVMPKRVCRTVAEMEALQAQAAESRDSLRH